MAAVRAASITLWMLAFALLAVALAALPGKARDKLLIRLSPLFCRGLLGLLRIRVSAAGEPGGTGRLVVANHVSWIDILVLASREPLCFLAKREVAAWPLMGTIAATAGTIFFDRQRKRGIPPANRAMAARLAQGRAVLLFPEGTTHDGRSRGRFGTSHLACLRDRFTCQPVGPGLVQTIALAYDDPAAAWIGDAALLPHVWVLLRRPPITCRLTFGQRRTVSPGFDRKRLGAILAEEVETLLAAEPEAAMLDAAELSRSQNDSFAPTTASVLASTGRSTLSGT